MKYITIATDISCDPRHKISTWACYIRYSGGIIKEVGEFKEYQNNTIFAETYALINALTIANRNIPDWNNSKIVIHNEIERVLTPLRTKNGQLKRSETHRSEAIMGIALPLLNQTASWERRKIKAHYKDWKTSDSPAKYAINRWCDIESRKLLRKIRIQNECSKMLAFPFFFMYNSIDR